MGNLFNKNANTPAPAPGQPQQQNTNPPTPAIGQSQQPNSLPPQKNPNPFGPFKPPGSNNQTNSTLFANLSSMINQPKPSAS